LILTSIQTRGRPAFVKVGDVAGKNQSLKAATYPMAGTTSTILGGFLDVFSPI
jgi:hypothetical protein